MLAPEARKRTKITPDAQPFDQDRNLTITKCTIDLSENFDAPIPDDDDSILLDDDYELWKDVRD